MNLPNTLRRVPRWALFALAAVAQVALIALMVADRVNILREGQEVKLRTRAVDPRDLLRGDYVTLNYDISTLRTADLKIDKLPPNKSRLYIRLVPDADGFYQPVSLHTERVPLNAGEVLVQGRAAHRWLCGNAIGPNLGVKYGIEKFFVPQGEGREIEKARNEGKVSIVAAVTPSGRAAIKRLLIDGKPVYDEPMF
jgi:uncharacterized membrane-anchored protein